MTPVLSSWAKSPHLKGFLLLLFFFFVVVVVVVVVFVFFVCVFYWFAMLDSNRMSDCSTVTRSCAYLKR